MMFIRTNIHILWSSSCWAETIFKSIIHILWCTWVLHKRVDTIVFKWTPVPHFTLVKCWFFCWRLSAPCQCIYIFSWSSESAWTLYESMMRYIEIWGIFLTFRWHCPMDIGHAIQARRNILDMSFEGFSHLGWHCPHCNSVFEYDLTIRNVL